MRRPSGSTAVLAAILLVAAGLRLWSIKHGLPFVYNVDEEQHFVLRAARLKPTLEPGYYINPPGLTYLLSLIFHVIHPLGGVRVAFDLNSEPFFVLGRVIVAALGVLTVWLTYLLGVRFHGRATGLVAAALMSVAYVPVWYSKQALNDVPTLVPMTIVLILALRYLDDGRRRDLQIAAVLAGVAAAVKYTSGVVLIAVLAALVLRELGGDRSRDLRWIRTGLKLAALSAVGFLAVHPYSVLNFPAFLRALAHQSTVSATHKVGTADLPVIVVYLRTLTWGFGWVPLALAILGAVIAVRRSRPRFVVLTLFPVVLIAFLSVYERGFSRWALPAYPVLAVLAGVAVVRIAGSRRSIAVALTLAACAQCAVKVVHLNQVLGETDTRAQARAWIVARVPPLTRIAAEPTLPRRLLIGRPKRRLYNVRIAHGDLSGVVDPAEIDQFRAQGICWVLIQGSYQTRAREWNRATADSYYAKLASESEPPAVFSQFHAGQSAPFDFELSAAFYADAVQRPGPTVSVYRLRDCTPSKETLAELPEETPQQ